MLILSFVGASAFDIKTAVAGRNSGGWEDEYGDGNLG